MDPERKRVTPLGRMVATSRRMVAVRRAPSRLARAGRRWHRAGLGRRQARHGRIVLLHVGGEDGVGARIGLGRRRWQPSDRSAATGRISRNCSPATPFASRGAAWPSTSVSFFAHPLAEGDTPMYGRLGRINPSCDKVRGAAFSRRFEPRQPAKVTCRAYMAPSGRLAVRGLDVSGRLRRPRGIP
jgi:hypothetical protein